MNVSKNSRKPNKALKPKLDSFMLKVNQEQHTATSCDLAEDMFMSDFWERAICRTAKKSSS